jgi:hypothetical protein
MWYSGGGGGGGWKLSVFFNLAIWCLQAFMHKVIELHEKYLQYVSKCFVNHSFFHKVNQLAIMLGLVIKWTSCCCYVPTTIISYLY